jgi:hypothetical protein
MHSSSSWDRSRERCVDSGDFAVNRFRDQTSIIGERRVKADEHRNRQLGRRVVDRPLRGSSAQAQAGDSS